MLEQDRPLRVGLLTSWRVPCGVYQYSARLAEALARQPSTQVVVLAGRADEHHSVPEEADPTLTPVLDIAQIGLWRDDQQYDIDVDAVMGLDLDVLHVQYQSMLFTQPHLEWLCGAFGGVKAITYHDNCVAPDFPHDAFDLHFAHRWNLGPPQVEVIPFGIENRPPVVRSFGLGRTRSDLIAPLCERRGWIYESCASHEPIQGGGQAWQSHQDLIQWLRGADAIVLWYDDVAAAGSSQAARTALATRRPVLTNDTTWFSDLPPRAATYAQVTTLEQLETELVVQFSNPYVEAHSWDNVATRLLQHYSTRT